MHNTPLKNTVKNIPLRLIDTKLIVLPIEVKPQYVILKIYFECE